MDLKKKLLDMAIAATDDKTITVAGDFEPKGLAWKRAAGATAGAFIGSEIGDGWTGIGAVAGAHAGQRAGTSGDLPPVVVLAASPTTLYVLTTNNAKGIISAKSLIKMGEHAREDLTFEMKQKLTVRTVVIHDEATGAEMKMEGRRILFHHMNDILDVLAGDEEEVTPTPTEAT